MQILCFVLIERNDHFLLICEASQKCRGKWFLPGGKVDKNESMLDAAVREVYEEAGCSVELTGLFYFRYFEKYLGDQLHIYLTGKTDCLELKNYQDNESLGAGWFSYENILKLPLRQNIIEVINAWRNKENPVTLPLSHFHLIR
jgi:8-oxo-dGTP pyrophosphatase MutT (NUDIX family)